MNLSEESQKQLWVIKFCLKVIFPKYNLYLFLVYLAIRFRILHYKENLFVEKRHKNRFVKMYTLCSVPHKFGKRLIDMSLEGRVDPKSYSNLCIVPQETYLTMATENPFYYDHNTVWVALRLSTETKEKLKNQNNAKDTNLQKPNLKEIKSKIHKQLWGGDESEKYENIRIVRIVGSKQIPDGTIMTCEDEEFNIKTSFGLPIHEKNIQLEIKPVPSMDYVPQIAGSAVVQMIVNPFDLSSEFVTELLSNYFKSPRLVHINDIFGIELTQEMTLKYYYTYFDLVQSTSKVYFKCCKINSDKDDKPSAKSNTNKVLAPYYIVKGKTELNLGENIHSIIPFVQYFTLESDESTEVLTELCPFGLRENFMKMHYSILPFLVNKQDNPLTMLANPVMPIFLLSGTAGSGRHILVKTLAKYNGISCMVSDCYAIQSSTAKQTESKINAVIQRAKSSSPVIVLLDNFQVFAVDAENNEDCRVLEYFRNALTNLFENFTKHPIIFIAISERQDLKPNILKLFLDKFHLTKPTNSERYAIIEWYLRVMNLKFEDEEMEDDLDKLNGRASVLNKKGKEILQRISAKTQTFLYGDLDTLVHFALRNSYMSRCVDGEEEVFCEEMFSKIREEDFTDAIESMRALQSEHMDAPKIPKVYWEDIGGLESLKEELLKTIELPIKYPHLFKNSSLKRSGILLYGPPGCGKTLVAKALSTELNVSFLSVKGPELLNMYIGQSEENVRKVFESARAASPCIVFLDELDALAPRRGATGDSGGASDRVVSQLLSEIDGVSDSGDDSVSSFVFIMGATNRPDLLEQSLLRPGRLDKLIYVGPYCGLEEKTRVLKALCNRKKLSDEISLEEVAGCLPERCTGADLMHVVNVAQRSAIRRAVLAVESGAMDKNSLDSESLVLESSDLDDGIAAFKPSTTDEEFAYYEQLKGQM